MNILVTAIGSFSGDSVIKSLKHMRHRVVGCDINPKNWLASAYDCDAFYQVPLAVDTQNYISRLIEICITEKIDAVLPLTDIEIDVLSEQRNEFCHLADLFIQSDDCLKIARNKRNMYLLFKNDTHVNVPDTAFYKSNNRLNLPCIAKPVKGRSSEGLKYINSQDEYESMILREDYIIQEYLEGHVFTVDYVRDIHSNDFAIAREELLRTKNGAGTTVRMIPDSELEKIASYVGQQINVVGCVNYEFILCNGKYYLIDINPRFSAGIAFSKFAGYDFVESSMNCFLNKNILPPIKFTEQIICKRHMEEKIC